MVSLLQVIRHALNGYSKILQVLVTVLKTDPERIRALLVRQIHSPVRWVECVRHTTDMVVRRAVEIGPGKVLAGLCKRIAPDLECGSSEELADLDAALAASAA